MVEDTWHTCAVPLMEAIAEREGALGSVSIGELAEETGIDPSRVATELERLIGAGYVAGELRKLMAAGDVRPFRLTESRLTAAGARVVGLWPADDPYEALLAAVEARLVDEEDEDQRGRWRRLRDALAEMGKAAIVGLTVEAAKRGAFGH